MLVDGDNEPKVSRSLIAQCLILQTCYDTQTIYLFSTVTTQEMQKLCKKNYLILQQHSWVPSIHSGGNCFCRALSFTVSGSEMNPRKIRLDVVKHKQTQTHKWVTNLRDGYCSVDDYIKRIHYVGVWATEILLLLLLKYYIRSVLYDYFYFWEEEMVLILFTMPRHHYRL